MPDHPQDTRRSQSTNNVNRTAQVEVVQQTAERLAHNVGQVILGKRNEVRLMVLGLLSQGHILIEDIPGVGKTMIAKALSRSLGCTFSRIQFTPDMLPSDVTGITIFNAETRKFEFRPGPILAQVVLADEINRATPKTQSALLEAMEERQVTVDGVTYSIQEPFIVMATQNPIEYEGTFPLPEAQLDRFMLRLTLGYPAPNEELAVLTSQQYEHPLNSVFQVVNAQELLTAQQAIREVYVADEIKRYIIDIVNGTRSHPKVALGSSPRGSLALFRTSQARAAMAGREYVIPDDVKALAEVTLAHRIIMRPDPGFREEVSSRVVVQEVLARTPIPGASVWQ